MTAVAAELEELERRGWEALSGPGGAEFYADVMADDGLMVFPGMVLDKAESIRAIQSAGSWASFELSDVRVIEGSADSAVIVYRAVAQRNGGQPYEALMSSAYVRRGGEWRLVLHQQSPDPA